jgi:hypothetical protein
MQATFTRKSQLPVFLLALALVGALMVGGMGGYLFKSLVAQSTPAVSRAGAAVGSSGLTNAIPAVDPLTGYASGSADDQRILTMLKQSGYEGGGTVVQGGSGRP